MRRVFVETLAWLKEKVVDSQELFDFFLAVISSGYGASYHELGRREALLKQKREQKRRSKQAERELRRRYYDFVYYLKKQGLVVETGKPNQKIFKLSHKGNKRLETIRSYLPNNRYQKESSDKFIMIIFDVPEKERKKRKWLRSALRNLGFRKVQLSVWIGKNKLPSEFLNDIKILELARCIQAFEVSKLGSLSALKDLG
jgi:DNA-binding transcriptional regulator PaaX